MVANGRIVNGSTNAVLSDAIRTEARRIGFDLVGIADAGTPESLDHFDDWLESGFDGKMGYLSRRREAYSHPEAVLTGSVSLVMLGMNYRASSEPSMGSAAADSDQPPTGIPARVARYATGSLDYHDVLRERLATLADFVHDELPGCRTRGIVDTAPLLERDFARLAGLGWFGKNTMLIDRGQGSWFFLAALLIDRPLEPDMPHRTDHCGTCTACLDACPTDAFPEPYVLDARRCISYLTIELRNEPIPPELREGMGEWIFGCDICQEVCPWNRDSPTTTEPAFEPITGLARPDLVSLLRLDEATFQQQLGATPLERPGRTGLVRNAAIVAGNSQRHETNEPLIELLDDDNPVIRGSAAWALGRIGSTTSLAPLRQRRSVENMEDVQFEIDAAIKAVSAGSQAR